MENRLSDEEVKKVSGGHSVNPPQAPNGINGKIPPMDPATEAERIAKERTGQIPGPADKTIFFNKMQDDELAIANV